MFGGHGLYLNGTMVALIADAVLYFKVDNDIRQMFVDAGMSPFTYAGKHKPVVMPYYTLPDFVFNDLSLLHEWLEHSYQAALRSNSKKKRN